MDCCFLMSIFIVILGFSLCHTKGLSTVPFRKAIELNVENIFGYARIEADYKNDVRIQRNEK